MLIRTHTLPVAVAGTTRQWRSLHFHGSSPGPKAYVQAALHADEVPPLLVAQALAERLRTLESSGRLRGEVVLVPMANPIGLAQDLQGSALGRFDLATGHNFNRHFRALTAPLREALHGQLGPDAAHNTQAVRAAMARQLAAWRPATEAEALKQGLQRLAHDADTVLDLHCDHEAVLHVYAGSAQVEALRPLARALGAQALLHTPVAGDDPFDEALARPWWELAAHTGSAQPVDPWGCVAATVELRGERDVSDALAAQDADALLAYLGHRGHLAADDPALGPLHRAGPGCAATPLEGVEPITAPVAGVLVFAKAPGEAVRAGEVVVEIVDPLDGTRTPVRARADGLCFARTTRRHASRGLRLAKIAGHEAWRSGPLLSL